MVPLKLKGVSLIAVVIKLLKYGKFKIRLQPNHLKTFYAH